MRNPWTVFKRRAHDGGDDSSKTWKNLQARCLPDGHNSSLIEGDDGKPLLIVSRWAPCKCLSSLAEAEAWVARVGGRNA
jgi:hypothetical protein